MRVHTSFLPWGRLRMMPCSGWETGSPSGNASGILSAAPVGTEAPAPPVQERSFPPRAGEKCRVLPTPPSMCGPVTSLLLNSPSLPSLGRTRRCEKCPLSLGETRSGGAARTASAVDSPPGQLHGVSPQIGLQGRRPAETTQSRTHHKLCPLAWQSGPETRAVRCHVSHAVCGCRTPGGGLIGFNHLCPRQAGVPSSVS